MNAIIRLRPYQGQKVVSAIELYEFLGFSMNHWKRWYTENIINNQSAIENEDYHVFDMMPKNGGGGTIKEFALSIDFAKKISMMTMTEKGEQVNQYLIDYEKEHNKMNELIKITEHNGSKAVSARELHGFLEVKTRFDKWANRMFEYGFTENIDYQALVKNDQTLKREVLEDYALSMDCAKEISMIQRSEKGKQARQYFIECEKELKSLPQPSQYHVPGSYAEALKLAYQQAEQIELQSDELKKQAPKVQYFDNVLQSASTYSTNQIFLELGMTSIALNKKLKEMGVQYKQNDTWFLYAKYRDKGYTKSKTHHYTGTDGTTQTKTYMVWTESGRLFVHGLIKGKEKTA